MIVRVLIIIAAVLAVLVGALLLGLRIAAPAFESIDSAEPTARTPIPSSLPEPVARYARAIYGDSLPQVQTAIVQGRATVTMNGIVMPARFRFYYDTENTNGRPAHYHDIQVTWYSLPVMQIHERFLDGHAMLDIPMIGRTENDPTTDAASNQGFWAETLAWVPAIPLADPRVRWEAIDANTARMIVPNADETENFTIRFDPETGMLRELTAMRYPDSSGRKLWTCRGLEWSEIDGTPTTIRSNIQWDSADPWVEWRIDEVALNVEVADRLARFGA